MLRLLYRCIILQTDAGFHQLKPYQAIQSIHDAHSVTLLGKTDEKPLVGVAVSPTSATVLIFKQNRFEISQTFSGTRLRGARLVELPSGQSKYFRYYYGLSFNLCSEIALTSRKENLHIIYIHMFVFICIMIICFRTALLVIDEGFNIQS